MTDTIVPVVLDTETTGWSPDEGDRVIEIAAARFDPITGELTEKFHEYVNPGFPIEAQATAIHGISNEMLSDKPSFAEIAGKLARFVRGTKLVIHNAPFDVRFLNAEFEKAGAEEVFETIPAQVVCTRRMARFCLPPQQPATLDALCDCFEVDRSIRTLHGALIDIALLAQVYLKLVPLNARREEAVNMLLPFPRGAELPLDKDLLGQAYAAIAQLIKLLQSEQERICAAIEPLLHGVNYEHRDFIASFDTTTSTDWKKVEKTHLQGVDLSKYQEEFEPKLLLKATRAEASLDLRQIEALETLMPFPLGAGLPADKDALGRAHTVIEQVIKQLAEEQGRIRAAIRPLLGGVNYEHQDFTAKFSPNRRTNWRAVAESHLQGVDLSVYKKTSKPKLHIKAT